MLGQCVGKRAELICIIRSFRLLFHLERERESESTEPFVSQGMVRGKSRGQEEKSEEVGSTVKRYYYEKETRSESVHYAQIIVVNETIYSVTQTFP